MNLTGYLAKTRLLLIAGALVVIATISFQMTVDAGPNPISATTSIGGPAGPRGFVYEVPPSGESIVMADDTFDSLVGNMIALAESGDPRARKMLVQSARRGVQQAQQVCDRLDIEWKR